MDTHLPVQGIPILMDSPVYCTSLHAALDSPPVLKSSFLRNCSRWECLALQAELGSLGSRIRIFITFSRRRICSDWHKCLIFQSNTPLIMLDLLWNQYSYIAYGVMPNLPLSIVNHYTIYSSFREFEVNLLSGKTLFLQKANSFIVAYYKRPPCNQPGQFLWTEKRVGFFSENSASGSYHHGVCLST